MEYAPSNRKRLPYGMMNFADIRFDNYYYVDKTAFNNKPVKWMVENSWGATNGYQGHLIMTDEWFDEYMFRLVVEKKFATPKVLEILKQKPIRLPAWDPMFAPEQ